jgi:hypothetical protein
MNSILVDLALSITITAAARIPPHNALQPPKVVYGPELDRKLLYHYPQHAPKHLILALLGASAP